MGPVEKILGKYRPFTVLSCAGLFHTFDRKKVMKLNKIWLAVCFSGLHQHAAVYGSPHQFMLEPKRVIPVSERFNVIHKCRGSWKPVFGGR